MEYFIGSLIGMTLLTVLKLLIQLYETGNRRAGAPRPIPKCKPRRSVIR